MADYSDPYSDAMRQQYRKQEEERVFQRQVDRIVEELVKRGVFVLADKPEPKPVHELIDDDLDNFSCSACNWRYAFVGLGSATHRALEVFEKDHRG